MKISYNDPHTTGIVSIIVPGSFGDTQRCVDKCLEHFTRAFGGASAVKLTGGWISSATKDFIALESTEIYSLVKSEKIAEEAFPSICKLASEICLNLNQDSILIKINGKGWFISRYDKPEERFVY